MAMRHVAWWVLLAFGLPGKGSYASSRPSICNPSDSDNVLTPGLIEYQGPDLNLQDCRITCIQNGAFNKVSFVTNLQLHNNKIDHIAAGAFDSLISLTTLDLTNNKLVGETLEPNVFKNIGSLRKLLLSGNNMTAAPENLLEGSNLDYLGLSNCSLHDVPAFVLRPGLKKLEVIVLSKNHLQKLDDPNLFNHLTNLWGIDLSGNEIDSLHKDVFKPIVGLRNINLQNNKIKHLPETLFQNLSLLMAVNLRHNYLTTVPVSAFSGTDLRSLTLSHNRFTNLPQNFCAQLKAGGAHELFKVSFYFNPWQCTCLNETLEEEKKLGITHVEIPEDRGDEGNDDEENKNKELQCVTAFDSLCHREGNDEEITRLYDHIMNNKTPS